MKNEETVFARACQECGHIQRDKDPGHMPTTTAFDNRKCRKCHSEALDYGHTAFTIHDGKIVRL